MVQLAQRVTRLTPSPIREILNVIDQPGMVSFAGGLPDADTLPEIAGVDMCSRQLQYGASEGDAALREQVARELQSRGLSVHAERVLILSGSQQGIDLVAKLLVEPGATVAVESPTYLAALQVFSLFGAQYSNFTPEQPQQILTAKAPRLIYSIPSFQNPTGHCYSAAQRAALLSVHAATDAVLFEDDPYGELAYEPCDTRPLCADVANESSWVYQSSFSKTLAPGIRLGFMTCSEDLWAKLVQLKQAADLHSNRVGQQIALALLQDRQREQRMRDLIARYCDKRDTFEALLQKHFAGLATWQCPQGGLFFWLTLISGRAIDTRTLLPQAIAQKVAFMPGEPFYAEERVGRNTLRLNFSQANASDADRGLATLAGLIQPLL